MENYYYKNQSTNYFITEDGKCYNQKTKKWLKGTVSHNGYLVYTLTIEGKSKKLFAHRMVMETYCPCENSDSLVINHRDFNPLNNCLDNLEWCSQSENIAYSQREGRYLKREIYCFDKDKKLIKVWKSLQEIKKEKGYQIGAISYNAKQKEKIKINGYYWSYENNSNFSIQTNKNTGKNKKVYQYTLNNELVAIYPSIKAATRLINGNNSHVGEACNGRIKTYKGYKWSFFPL